MNLGDIPFLSEQFRILGNMTTSGQLKYMSEGTSGLFGGLWNGLLGTIAANPIIAAGLIIVSLLGIMLSLGNNKASSWFGGVIAMLVLFGFILIVVYMLR